MLTPAEQMQGLSGHSCARPFSVLFESFHNKNLKNRLKVKKKKVGTRSDRNRGPGHKDVVPDVPSPPCPPALPTGENKRPARRLVSTVAECT